MTIVLTAQGTDWDAAIDPRFGRARYLLVYREDEERLEAIDNAGGVGQAHGAGPQTAKKVADLGAEVVITGNGPGGNAAAVLGALGVRVFAGAGGMTAAEALAAWREGSLQAC